MRTRVVVYALAVSAWCLCSAIRSLSAQTSASAPMTFRIILAAGATYIHQPSFSYVRGSNPPRTEEQRETDGGGLAFGGAIELERDRLWGGVSGQFIVPILSSGTAQLLAAYVGVSRPALAGTLRAGLGPVLARGARARVGRVAIGRGKPCNAVWHMPC